MSELNALVTQALSDFIRPVVLIDVKPDPSGKVSGRFRSGALVFGFLITDKKVTYKPLSSRGDSSDEAIAAYSASYLLGMYGPKFNAQREDAAAKRKCATGYSCGATCISLKKECGKVPASSIGKERLRKIAAIAAGAKDPSRGLGKFNQKTAAVAAFSIEQKRNALAEGLRAARTANQQAKAAAAAKAAKAAAAAAKPKPQPKPATPATPKAPKATKPKVEKETDPHTPANGEPLEQTGFHALPIRKRLNEITTEDQSIEIMRGVLKGIPVLVGSPEEHVLHLLAFSDPYPDKAKGNKAFAIEWRKNKILQYVDIENITKRLEAEGVDPAAARKTATRWAENVSSMVTRETHPMHVERVRKATAKARLAAAKAAAGGIKILKDHPYVQGAALSRQDIKDLAASLPDRDAQGKPIDYGTNRLNLMTKDNIKRYVSDANTSQIRNILTPLQNHYGADKGFDPALVLLAEKRGISNAKPQLVKGQGSLHQATNVKLDDDGKPVILYRGVRSPELISGARPDTAWTAEFVKNDAMTGMRGIYGNGYYFAGSNGAKAKEQKAELRKKLQNPALHGKFRPKPDAFDDPAEGVADFYAGSRGDEGLRNQEAGAPGIVTATALRKDAKVIGYNSALTKCAEQVLEMSKGGASQKELFLMSNVGRWAMANGYDAIMEPNGDGGKVPFYIVLNRSALLVASQTKGVTDSAMVRNQRALNTEIKNGVIADNIYSALKQGRTEDAMQTLKTLSDMQFDVSQSQQALKKSENMRYWQESHHETLINDKTKAFMEKHRPALIHIALDHQLGIQGDTGDLETAVKSYLKGVTQEIHREHRTKGKALWTAGHKGGFRITADSLRRLRAALGYA